MTRGRLAALGGLVVIALGGAARAETPLDTPAAIDLERDTSSPGRPELAFDGGAPLVGWAASLTGSWIEEPIVLRDEAGPSAPVARRQTLALGGALALGDSAVIDARLPLAHQTGDRLRLAGGGGERRALDRWVPGDLRLGARLRLLERPRGAALVRADLTLPTGDDRDFAGEPAWTLTWRLIGRRSLAHGIVVAVSGGVRLRGAEVRIGDRLVSDELVGAAGVVVPLPAVRPLWCDPAQVKLTAEIAGVLANDVGGQRGPSPAEARLGIVTHPRGGPLVIGVRVGAGLGDEIGAPAWRATVEFAYLGTARLLPPLAVTSDDE